MTHQALTSSLKRPACWPPSGCRGTAKLTATIEDGGHAIAIYVCKERTCRHTIVVDVSVATTLEDGTPGLGLMRNDYAPKELVEIG